MDVSSGLLVMTQIITWVFHGGNAQVGYGACLTILIASAPVPVSNIG